MINSEPHAAHCRTANAIIIMHILLPSVPFLAGPGVGVNVVAMTEILGSHVDILCTSVRHEQHTYYKIISWKMSPTSNTTFAPRT